MKQNEARLENKTPKEATNMAEKPSSKDRSEVRSIKLKLNRIERVCQHCKKYNISQNCKPAMFGQQNHMNTRLSWRITSPLIPLRIFSFILQRFVSEKLGLPRYKNL